MRRAILVSAVVALVTASNAETLTIEKDGWNLLGSSQAVTPSQYFSDSSKVKVVWSWDNVLKTWKAYSNNTSIKNALTSANIPQIETIKAGSGFWVQTETGAQNYTYNTTGATLLVTQSASNELIYLPNTGGSLFVESGKSYTFTKSASETTRGFIINDSVGKECVVEFLDSSVYSSVYPDYNSFSISGGYASPYTQTKIYKLYSIFNDDANFWVNIINSTTNSKFDFKVNCLTDETPIEEINSTISGIDFSIYTNLVIYGGAKDTHDGTFEMIFTEYAKTTQTVTCEALGYSLDNNGIYKKGNNTCTFVDFSIYESVSGNYTYIGGNNNSY
jgi:hypothetical protein